MLHYGQITNGAIYFEDKSLIGICKSFQIPEPSWKTNSHTTLGSTFTMNLPTRQMDELKGSIKLAFQEPELHAHFANPNKTVSFFIEDYVDVYNQDGFDESNSVVRKTVVRAQFNKFKRGEQKPGEAEEYEAEYSAVYLSESLATATEPMTLYDLFANKARVSGENIWN